MVFDNGDRSGLYGLLFIVSICALTYGGVWLMVWWRKRSSPPDDNASSYSGGDDPDDEGPPEPPSPFKSSNSMMLEREVEDDTILSDEYLYPAVRPRKLNKTHASRHSKKVWFI